MFRVEASLISYKLIVSFEDFNSRCSIELLFRASPWS
jgi:hypothetical protein